jgi:hypothetical protein
MLKPIFIENSRVPVWLSKLAPIEINAITLVFLVFSRGEISERTKRHETIHFHQWMETLILGFLLIYILDFLWACVVKGKGFTRASYLSIRFEQEAHSCDAYSEYLENRSRFAWTIYPLGGDEEDEE